MPTNRRGQPTPRRREGAAALAELHRKYATARLQKAPTDGSGRFTAIVSTFGPPPDTQGDVIAPGAFLRSILDWRVRGKRPTVWWMHQYDDPINAIGTIERLDETDQGLLVEGQLDLASARAQVVYEAMLAGKLNEFSIGYGVVAEHREKDYNLLTEVELLEVSVVMAGANRFTQLVDVKTATTTSGSNATVIWTATPATPINAGVFARLDAIALGDKPRDPEASKAVDDLVLEVREELVRESIDRAEQAAWEERQLTMVLDPPPVRVDSRMRPDR